MSEVERRLRQEIEDLRDYVDQVVVELRALLAVALASEDETIVDAALSILERRVGRPTRWHDLPPAGHG